MDGRTHSNEDFDKLENERDIEASNRETVLPSGHEQVDDDTDSIPGPGTNHETAVYDSSSIERIERKVNLIVGKRGSGKSYLVNRLVRDIPRMLIYDTQGEYTCGVCFDHGDYEHMLSFWMANCDKRFRLIYRPRDAMDVDEFDGICALVYALGDMAFVCEEVHTYCQTNKVTPHFKAILSRGRHKNIEVYGVTQRPFGIDRYLSSQAKRAYLFATNEPRDLQYVRDYFGYAVFNQMGRLGQYEHVLWDGEKSIVTKV